MPPLPLTFCVIVFSVVKDNLYNNGPIVLEDRLAIGLAKRCVSGAWFKSDPTQKIPKVEDYLLQTLAPLP